MSEVAIYQPRGELVPVAASPRGELDDWIMVADQVVRLAEVICRSPFVPDGLRGSAPATAAAILTGRELGIPPMTSLANIHVIHGKPGLSAMVMRALIQGQGHEWVDVEVTNTRVVVKGRRKGAAEWTTASFSTADAQTAKLQLGGYPQDKLYARASARLARRAFADVIAGMPYSAEELEDGLSDEDGPAAVAAAAVPADASAEQPKQRTAQRRTRTPAPAQPAPAPAAAATVQAASAGAGLPPLPGEEEDPTPSPQASSSAGQDPPPAQTGEPSPSSPGNSGSEPATNRQLTAIWTALTADFEFGGEEKEQARMTCGLISGRGSDLASTKELSKQDAATVIDTLGHLKAQADREGEHPRSLLIALLAQREEGEATGGE